jgi:hypothetical protein
MAYGPRDFVAPAAARLARGSDPPEPRLRYERG